MTDEVSSTPIKDYSEYWAIQVVLVRILQSSGVTVNVKDRLPLFRLWTVVSSRMTGAKQHNILQLIQALVHMRMKGMEPEHDGKKYK